VIHVIGACQNGYAELKNRLRGAAFILRSKSPELVCQELFAFLTVYQALCVLKLQTARQAGIDPDRISFTVTVRVARDHASSPALLTQPGRAQARRQAIRDLLDDLIANIAVFAYYFWQRRSDFNIILHVLFPLTPTGGLIYALVYSFIPFPAAPYECAPLIDGIWLFLGLVILLVMWRQQNDRWLLTAGAALGESEETDTAAAVRQNRSRGRREGYRHITRAAA
jgi:hypothetical protein